MKLRLTSPKKYKVVSTFLGRDIALQCPRRPSASQRCAEFYTAVAVIPPATARAGTSQRDVPTTSEKASRYGGFNSQSGLTLVEILVASALLLFITLGLTMMFNQTARAFRSGVKQVDVLEGGRAALNLMSRDVEQMGGNVSGPFTNVFVGLGSGTPPVVFTPPGGGPNDIQTNFLQKFFFLSYQNGWQGLGYRVLNLNPANLNDTNILVGSLYRFSTNSESSHLFDAFLDFPQKQLQNSNLHRIVDGVVHLQMKTYDRNGFLINTLTNNGPTLWVTNDVYFPANDRPKLIYFRNGGLPAFVEVELGVLEPQTLEQVKPMVLSGNINAARQFILSRPGNIHIFRQQIPIRPAR